MQQGQEGGAIQYLAKASWTQSMASRRLPLLALASALVAWSHLQLQLVPTAHAAPIYPRDGLGEVPLNSRETAAASSFSCELCKVVSGALELFLEEESSEEEIEKVIAEVCILLKIEDARVCKAAIVEFKVG